jgi:hypothetical protein
VCRLLRRVKGEVREGIGGLRFRRDAGVWGGGSWGRRTFRGLQEAPASADERVRGGLLAAR